MGRCWHHDGPFTPGYSAGVQHKPEPASVVVKEDTSTSGSRPSSFCNASRYSSSVAGWSTQGANRAVRERFG
jgi:hypothetical protein